MAKARFTEEQIADFLQQSKDGVPNKVLCEKYGFSLSTLRRWQELHAQGIRQELNKLESIAAIVCSCFFIVAMMLGLAFPTSIAMWILPPFMVCCISYIRRFRAVSAKHIQEENVYLSRSGRGGNNVFYQLAWSLTIFFAPLLIYVLLHLF